MSQRRGLQSYSEEQRCTAAAAFYVMSRQFRELLTVEKNVLKSKQIDRDYFFLIVLVYITSRWGAVITVSDLAEFIGRTWPTTQAKLEALKRDGLVEIDDHPEDGRGWSIKPGQRLPDVLGAVLDMLIDCLMMTAKRIKAQGTPRRIPKEVRQRFDEEISKISRLRYEGR